MTGEEKRRLLKEQYKQDLRKRKDFLEQTKKLRQMRNVNKAVGDMLEGMKDDSDDWINKLNEGTALSEAKLDMALDQAVSEEEKLDSLAKEIEMEKMNAQMMVEQMKRELGLSTVEVEVEIDEATDIDIDVADEEGEETDAGPGENKTMGDF